MAKTIQEKFERFNRNNPTVYRQIVQMARASQGNGCQRMSINYIFEKLRYEMGVKGLSNDFRSRYVRMLEDENQDLIGLFGTKVLRSE